MDAQQITEVARGISDYGAMAVMAAIYLLLSSAMMITIFMWFRSIINRILGSIVKNEDEHTELLIDISEGLRVETQLRIRNLSGFAFDLSIERVCKLIKRIREENHIADKDATMEKIKTLLRNIHDDRCSRFDAFIYKKKPLSFYCSASWVDKVTGIVGSEIYNEHGADDERAYTNVKMAYDEIKLDFYHKLNY